MPVQWSPAVIGNSFVIAAHDNAILRPLMVGDFDTPQLRPATRRSSFATVVIARR